MSVPYIDCSEFTVSDEVETKLTEILKGRKLWIAEFDDAPSKQLVGLVNRYIKFNNNVVKREILTFDFGGPTNMMVDKLASLMVLANKNRLLQDTVDRLVSLMDSFELTFYNMVEPGIDGITPLIRKRKREQDDDGDTIQKFAYDENGKKVITTYENYC